MLEVKGITKSFGDFNVLSDISFQAEEGEIYGLIGYNGVGKTTLLKMMCGIYRPDAGEIRIQDQPVYEHADIKRQCFFMTEESTHFHQASLKQMQKFYRGYYPDWNDQTFQNLVNLLGMNTGMKISRFSKGMQRQAGLILAFSSRAKYLFLDEAFDGLDVTMRQLMKDMICFYARKEQALVVVSSHNLLELEHLADRIGMLNEGELIYNESLDWMHQHYCTCSFLLPDASADIGRLSAEILEQKEQEYTCVIEAPGDEARRRLNEIGAVVKEIRPIQLEEFFRKERREKNVDWEKVFE